MSGPQKTILAVDDERDITEMLTLLLESEGYRVLTASGGAEALSLLESEKPDLILLDIMMPGVDGHQVCRAIREHKRFEDVPVVMLTAKNDVVHIAQAVDEGADGFIVKPFEVEQLLRTLRMRLEGKIDAFYRSSKSDTTAKVGEDERIIFIDLLEPEDVFSVVMDACKGQQHTLLSLWQEEVAERRLQTSALVSVSSTADFGDLLNCIFGVPEVRVLNCFIYRGMAEIPEEIRNRAQ